MHGYALACADTDAATISQPLAVEGGHLFIGHNGYLLHYSCIAAGLPVIDARQVGFPDLWRIVVSESEADVGTPEELRVRHWVPYASLAMIAGFYHAVGAEVFNLPGVTATAEAAL